jgi:secondary thiamine-phosphate synthase enzyme
MTYSGDIVLRTAGKGTYEITRDVQKIVAQSGVTTGLVSVFIQHTSCSLVMMENAAPAARRDLEQFFDRLVPENTPYFEHTDEGPDDMPSHIRIVLSDYRPQKAAIALLSHDRDDYPAQVRRAAVLK